MSLGLLKVLPHSIPSSLAELKHACRTGLNFRTLLIKENIQSVKHLLLLMFSRSELCISVVGALQLQDIL